MVSRKLQDGVSNFRDPRTPVSLTDATVSLLWSTHGGFLRENVSVCDMSEREEKQNKMSRERKGRKGSVEA